MSKFKNAIETLNNNIQKAQFTVKKNSPVILVATGVVGLAATAVLAYKAHANVTEITERYEQEEQETGSIDRTRYAIDVALAVAPTVVVGTLSVASILGSYHVLNNRVAALASALAASTAENQRIRKFIKENHPEVNLVPHNGTTQVEKVEEVDGKKKTKIIDAINVTDPSILEGLWLSSSYEYARDDEYLNAMYIEDRIRKLSNKLYAKGFLSLNEVWEAFNIRGERQKRKEGAILGWTDADYFDIDFQPIEVSGENGLSYVDFYINWTQPTYIYDRVNMTEDMEKYNY